MEIKRITGICFSPTGNTRKVIDFLGKCLAEKLSADYTLNDFTCPSMRGGQAVYEPDDLVIFGLPVYAGRVPNKILPLVQTLFRGNHTPAVPVVTFGNRSMDNGLMELKLELEKNGFFTLAAAAVVAEHAFTSELATGRPDAADFEELDNFAKEIFQKISAPEALENAVVVPGDNPVGPYYTPLGTDGKPAVFLKAKPVTDIDKCIRCGLCASVCPMGSIDTDDCSVVNGICIKCHACVRHCPQQAKSFDDAAFLSHVEMLKAHYKRPATSEFFW